MKIQASSGITTSLADKEKPKLRRKKLLPSAQPLALTFLSRKPCDSRSDRRVLQGFVYTTSQPTKGDRFESHHSDGLTWTRDRGIEDTRSGRFQPFEAACWTGTHLFVGGGSELRVSYEPTGSLDYAFWAAESGLGTSKASPLTSSV